MLSLVIDFFGKHVSFFDREDGMVCCRLKVSTMAMKHWAVEHANMVKVVSPESLVEEIREEIRKAAEMYGLDEAQNNGGSGTDYIRSAQIPIRADRFRYLTGQYCRVTEDGQWEMYSLPGGLFSIYDKVNGNCVFDAVYQMLREPENQPDDESVAVVTQIRTRHEGSDHPEAIDDFAMLLNLIENEL